MIRRPLLRVASYNIRKAIGLDRRRDPERTLGVIKEIDAHVVALQEADRRFGSRASAIPPHALRDFSALRPVPLDTRPDSMGWHGNALLVHDDIFVAAAGIIPLPTLEPRGAIWADLIFGDTAFRTVAMHLDLSGIRRRQQVRTILQHSADCTTPLLLMGDMNIWSPRDAIWREFDDRFTVLAPGRSFHTRRPIAMLDRIIVSRDIHVSGCGVHHSARAARASDHLPVRAHLQLPKN
jgi:endonuclease/exonuclease/phosphatase family metal-dependent hydrolase